VDGAAAVSSAYSTGLDKNPANFAALSPVPFLEWAAQAAPDHPAVIHGNRRYSWSETYARCRRLASALVGHGIRPGETVAVMLSNTPEMYECHFGVPMTGAVLNCLNTRLDAANIAFILDHGEARVVITDREFSVTMSAALAAAKVKPLVIYDIDHYLGIYRKALDRNQQLADSTFRSTAARIAGLDQSQAIEGLLQEVKQKYKPPTPMKEVLK
jgi:fatty-acyl-CoA synthase